MRIIHTACNPITFLSLLPLVACTLVGCTLSSSSTKKETIEYMTGYADPDYRSAQYRVLSVHMTTTDLDEKRTVEKQVTDRLRKLGLKAHEAGYLLPPTREWDSATVRSQLIAEGVEASLWIRESETWSRSWWIPREETTTTRTTETTVEKKEKEREKKNEEVVETTTEVKTRTEGGYNEREEYVRYDVEIVDVRSGRTAWRGTLSLRTERYKTLARKVVGQLSVDRMVASDTSPPA